MDRTCERNKTRAVSKELGYNLAVPSKKNRLDPWEYDWENSINAKTRMNVSFVELNDSGRSSPDIINLMLSLSVFCLLWFFDSIA